MIPLPKNPKHRLIAAGVGLLVLVLYLTWLWQPERQVERHFDNLVRSVEKRNWNRFVRLLAEDYQDQWGFDRETIRSEAPDAFRHFFGLNIDTEDRRQVVVGDRAQVTTVLRIRGEGTAVAQMVRSEVNRIHEPFIFYWEKRSWKPWDWQLVRVENERLSLDRYRSMPGAF